MLVAARSQMPEILGFSRVSVADFIERVELRSSLLMLSGHEIEGGTLTPVYEFRHLTFQEYLTAKAIVEGHYPGHRETDTLLGMLSDHMLDESWEEVVLLSSVLAGGRKIQPLIQHLISECKQLDRFALRHEQGKTNPANMLAKCVIDEIQLTPQLLDESLKWIVRKSDYPNPARVISQGRYGDVFKAVALRELSTATDDFLGIGGTVLELTAEELGWPSGEPGDPTIHQMLSSDSWIEKCRACLAFIQLAFHVANTHEEEPTKLKEVVSEFASVVYPLMGAPQPFLKFAATWAVVWTLKAGVLGPNPPEYIGQQLGKFWQTEKNADMSYVSGWGISWFPVKSRDRSPFGTVDRAFVSNMLSRPPEQRQSIRRRWNVNRGASLVMCYYCPGIIEDDELIATLKESSEPVPRNELLKQLGVTVDDDPK
jgi:hypothetical protein